MPKLAANLTMLFNEVPFLERALPYAQALNCRQVHMMAGIPPEGADRLACRDAYVANLRAAVAFFAPHGIAVLAEPINSRDVPGYFLSHQGQAVALIEIAGVPERHEPDRGEVNYPYLFGLLDELGYDGWVGCEYRPAGDTLAGLGWARAYGVAPTPL